MMGLMGSSKHDLKHLLSEDQEPFVMRNYINDKRSERAKKPIPANPRFSSKHSCLFSFQESPDLKKSPLFEFSKFDGAPKSVFVHIPPETAALLLEAALRIEKSQLEKEKSKSKSLRNVGFGFFGSIMKRIRSGKRKGGEVENVTRWEEQTRDVSGIVSEKREEEEAEVETALGLEDKRSSDMGFCCSSSAWTDKSHDIETTSTSTIRSEETEFIVQHREFNSDETLRCHRSPEEIVSPATSPNHRKNQVAKNEERDLSSDGKESKEEAEHFSPISVLDLDVEGQDEEEQEDEDDSELERSFAFVQKAKHKLLRRLQRFERLAELNPLELEKRIAEDEDEDDEESGDEDDDDSVLQDSICIAEVLNVSNCSNRGRIPLDTKRLVIALMSEDLALTESNNRALKSNKLRKRLNSLKNIERSTINMMVQMDFRAEQNEWQKNSEHVEETVVEVELAVFGFLMEELSAELVHSNNTY